MVSSSVANTSTGDKSTRSQDSPLSVPSDDTTPPGESDSPFTATPTTDSSTNSDHHHELIQIADRSHLIVTGLRATAKVIAWRASGARTRAPSVGIDHWFLRWPAWSIYAALTKHGLMMGTSCADCIYDSVSPASYESLPETLRPTPLQLVVPHRRWIDRFPFVRLRDNMILLYTLLDLDEFCGDLFNTASLSLKPSAPSWDPRSWVLGEEFASKWGYLFR